MSCASRVRRSSGTGGDGAVRPLAISPPTGVPHSGQKRKPGSIAAPQFVHAIGARAPQLAQNGFPGMSSL
jgi:hypothetical protein